MPLTFLVVDWVLEIKKKYMFSIWLPPLSISKLKKKLNDNKM